ncbi:SubName: Full=Probable Pelota protein {ECO:0000313/EMBL:CCA69977.1} [Serendipita indica DSM 11827]|nr:SubName: Full=Probable Pelota protein {ECO:0000313/EMBL:CCA69977.1} [Serendipita indica DSM 11827]
MIYQGDDVQATTLRRVQTVSNTGSTDSQRVRTRLTLHVTRTQFAAGSSSSSATASSNAAASSTNATASSSGASGGVGSTTGAGMHITGRVTEENAHVKMGAFHTLDIEVNRDVKIIKQEWDRIALDRVDEACAEGRGAEVGAIVCGEGTAALCLMSEHMTTIRQRIDVPVPRKAAGSASHEKGLDKFYSTLYAAFLRVIPFASLKISSQLKETKFAREGIMLDKFFKMLGQDEMRAWYGPDHVALAADRGAIGALLISDDLFRSSDPTTRKRYVEMADAVRTKGAEVLIFSSMHETGQQLNQLSGIAAILTFPLDIDMVEEEERQAKEEAEAAATAEQNE